LTVLPFRKPDPHILVVEDDDNTLEVFVEFIQMAITPKVGGVYSVWAAIDYLNRNRRVDLVLTDINLAPVAPGIRGMNGIDLTAIIRRNWDIPVIVMTGYKPEVRRPLAIQAGASHFFAKPVSFKALEAAIRRLLVKHVAQTGGTGVSHSYPKVNDGL
jgi:CheY-like chemotaxis protein